MADGTRHHVDDEVCLAVVETGSIAEVEGGRGRARNDVVEMDLQPRFVKLASDERTDQAPAQTVNPHDWCLDHRVSKVPALYPAA